MSYCQCRLKMVFASIFQQFGWKHVALLLDRSDLFSLTVGKWGGGGRCQSLAGRAKRLLACDVNVDSSDAPFSIEQAKTWSTD